MSELYIVRHGQAGSFEKEYDNLSEHGRRQAASLGEHFARRGVQFGGLVSGSLKRQQQTLALAAGPVDLNSRIDEGLNEFDLLQWRSMARYVIEREPGSRRTWERMMVEREKHSSRYAALFALLNRRVMSRWQQGQIPLDVMDGPAESFSTFKERVLTSFGAAARQAVESGRPVLAVSSATPIALLFDDLFGAEKKNGWLELSVVIANSSLSVIRQRRRRIYAVTFNSSEHLDLADRTLM